MAEGTEKSIQERIEETRMDQAIKIQEGTVSSSAVWDCHREEHEGITEENIKEHVEECLGEMLNNYIEDERNYALDGAVIRCDQMSDKAVFIQFTENGSKIRLEGSVGTITSEYTKPAGIGPERYNPEFEEWVIDSHVGEENIRKLHAVSGNSQTDNGIRFATVIDRSYLREEEEKFGPKSDKYAKSKKKEIKFVDARVKNECAADKETPVSIVSCGNCKKLEEKDIKKIAENWDGVCKYGTCYALMQLASNWINPYCMESIAGECKGEDFLSPFSGLDAASHTLEYATCVIEHHRPIKFSTTEGEKEGLTMMSTLLCGKEGIITIEASGQIYVEPKAEDIGISYEFKYDWTKEGATGSENLTSEFLERVIEIAEELEIDPDDLMAVMAFESKFTLNAVSGSGAYGLIQFTQISLDQINKNNGTSYKKSDLLSMGMMEQLELVYLHYKPKAGLMYDLGDVYLVTLAPAFVKGEVLEDSTIIYSESDGNNNYKNNKGLDKDGKGFITKGDGARAVMNRREEYLYE